MREQDVTKCEFRCRNLCQNGQRKTAAETGDRIEWVKLSLAFLPLATPVSDAKVLTGRQKPLTEVAIIIAEIRSRDGFEGVGFSYSKRAGGQGIYAHAKEIADNLLGEDPNDIDKIYTKLLWAGASVGRSGMAVRAISLSTSPCGI